MKNPAADAVSLILTGATPLFLMLVFAVSAVYRVTVAGFNPLPLMPMNLRETWPLPADGTDWSLPFWG